MTGCGRPENKIDSDNIRFASWSEMGNNRDMITNVLGSCSSGIFKDQESLV